MDRITNNEMEKQRLIRHRIETTSLESRPTIIDPDFSINNKKTDLKKKSLLAKLKTKLNNNKIEK